MAIRATGPSGQCDNEPGAAEAALPELLAPAGGLDQMLAAIAAGADAIYAGLGGFNARVSAHGFTDDEFAAVPWRVRMVCACMRRLTYLCSTTSWPTRWHWGHTRKSWVPTP